MANANHLRILRQGAEAWNSWRERNRSITPDLSETRLWRAHLSGADLSGAKLQRANLSEARLAKADLSAAQLQDAYLGSCDLRHACLQGAALMGANLRNADLKYADLRGVKINDARAPYANFSGGKLQKAYLWGSDFREADFKHADMSEANLMNAQLACADFRDANLTGAKVFGISAWKLKLNEGTEQHGLVITDPNYQSQITVDDIEVAQFVYLLIDNKKLRNVIETMTSKAVLILGNFTSEQKKVLDAIKERLRDHDYLPILFDFTGPQNQRFIDTITTVARLSRFVVADLTHPRTVTAELTAIVEQLPLLPIQPLILKSEEPPLAFITDLVVSDSVLKLHRYTNLQDLLASFDESIIDQALKRRGELEVKRLRMIEEKR